MVLMFVMAPLAIIVLAIKAIEPMGFNIITAMTTMRFNMAIITVARFIVAIRPGRFKIKTVATVMHRRFYIAGRIVISVLPIAA
jgi:hypothetical protein